MTSREIVRRTVTFNGPERIAMSFPPPYPNDFCSCGPTEDPKHPETSWVEVEPGCWEHTDAWGNTWTRMEDHTKGEVIRGAVEEWDQLDEIELPDYNLPDRYDRPRQVFSESPDKFKLGGIPGFPFSIARKMRWMENFLMDVVAEPDRVKRLLGMVEEQLHHAVRHLADAGADAIMFCEDWGTQDRLLVRPQVWRKLFKPGFARLCHTAHGCGVSVFMHSCGYIYEAMNDMMEAGIDLFQLDQPALYGLDRLAEEFGGRVCFWCPVDIQRTLQSRDAAAIEHDARKMVERLGAKGGGFIAGYYGGNEAIGLDPRWQDLACRFFLRYGAPRLWEEMKDQLPELDLVGA